MDIDFGKAADDYANHRAGFPDSLFERLFKDGTMRTGDRLLDLGTGTGTLARGFAARDCVVTGLDPSPAMLAEARRLAEIGGLAATFREGRAEATGEPDLAFDVVAAGQCWHWFDGSAAAAEIKRVLRPGGTVVVAHFDWLPTSDSVAHATEEIVLRINPDWRYAGGNGVNPQAMVDLAAAGFTDIESFSYDVGVRYSHIAWRGRMRASAGVAAVLEPARVAAFDTALERMLAVRFPADPLSILHRVWVMRARTRLTGLRGRFGTR